MTREHSVITKINARFQINPGYVWIHNKYIYIVLLSHFLSSFSQYYAIGARARPRRVGGHGGGGEAAFGVCLGQTTAGTNLGGRLTVYHVINYPINIEEVLKHYQTILCHARTYKDCILCLLLRNYCVIDNS